MTTTKIDLDELERRAETALTEHGWRVYRCRSAGEFEACGIKDEPFVSEDKDCCQRGVVVDTNRDECQHAMSLADAEHIAANDPHVTLALVARILELEVFARQLIHDHVRHVDETEMHALLEKGAVLP